MSFFSSQAGDTPLHFATSIGNTEIARLMLEHKADVDALNKVHNRVNFGVNVALLLLSKYKVIVDCLPYLSPGNMAQWFEQLPCKQSRMFESAH